jgi:hypothetical protein
MLWLHLVDGNQRLGVLDSRRESAVTCLGRLWAVTAIGWPGRRGEVEERKGWSARHR